MATTKKRRKLWTDELARQTHSNNRRKLAREAAKRAQQAEERARRGLILSRGREKDRELNRRAAMVNRGLTPRLQAVMASWGINIPVTVRPSSEIGAYTDFKSITVNHDSRLGGVVMVDVDGAQVAEPVPTEVLTAIAAETRGLFYHEVGHILFTTPVRDLCRIAEAEGADLSFITEGRVTPTQTRSGIATYSISGTWNHAWNILEDQRMEMALVQESPQLAAYLTVLVIRVLANSAGTNLWALTAGRTYLPDDLRALARDAWVHPVDADAVEEVISRYSRATTATEMVQAISDWSQMFDGLNMGDIVDSHGYLEEGGRSNEEAQEQISKAGSKAGEGMEDFGPGGNAQGEGEGDEAGTTEDGDTEVGSKNGSKAGTGSSITKKDPTFGERDTWKNARMSEEERALRDQLKDEYEEAVANAQDDQRLQDDVASMNQAYADAEGLLVPWTAMTPLTDPADVHATNVVADDLERAFRIATEDVAPHWETQQRRGALDPIRYVSRQPGDMEIFRSYVDGGEPGADLAVSLFLDVSGSMDSSGKALGQAAWAVKKACDALNIDCDVTLFAHQGFTLWGPNEAPSFIPNLDPNGGTDPSDAFSAVLEEERRDKNNHLVVIMTDGEWNNYEALDPFKHSNMTVVGINYSTPWHRSWMSEEDNRPVPMKRSERFARRIHAHEGYESQDLFDIPKIVENILVSLV